MKNIKMCNTREYKELNFYEIFETLSAFSEQKDNPKFPLITLFSLYIDLIDGS